MNINKMTKHEYKEEKKKYQRKPDVLPFFIGGFTEDVRPDQFYLSKSSQLMGCVINKVASSSLVFTFLTLEGILHENDTYSPHVKSLLLTPMVNKLRNNLIKIT